MENINQHDLKIKELRKLLETIKWEDGFIFTFNDVEFYIRILDSKEDNLEGFGGLVDFFQSTYVNGFDIYLNDTIPHKDRKRILFHGILEASVSYHGSNKNIAHETALREEEKIFGKRK